MPNIKSAKKRVKVNATKAAANKARKSNLKTILKKADDAESIKVAIKRVDQACAKGLMHKNKAAIKKSVPADNSRSAGLFLFFRILLVTFDNNSYSIVKMWFEFFETARLTVQYSGIARCGNKFDNHEKHYFGV